VSQAGALAAVLAAALAWMALGLAAVALPRRRGLVTGVLFPASAAVGLVVMLAGFAGLQAGSAEAVLPLGLPGLPFHLRLDALSAFFLVILGLGGATVALFSAGYFRATADVNVAMLCLQFHVFLAAMALVLVADDAYAFMVAWETMALASFFLVLTDHRVAQIRHAAFLYLLIAHVGALALLLCFGVLQAGTGDYTFAAMRHATIAGAWPAVAFFLALAGFGAKAGLLPLHVWLPEAHPAAPSPVSALMSGVMLKTAIYGLLRVGLDLTHALQWWWGAATLALGLATALYGVLFATVQTDMKRLLAYSSIENIGIIVAGLGLALLFAAYGKPLLAGLALAAARYHALNHAVFKTLLFLATGAVLHATGERGLGRLGGLIHRMPWVAATALVGALAIAGMPPLNGFVSEWLLLQAFLFTPSLPQSFVNMLVPLAAAALALAVALSGYAMVKFFGVIFLGVPREPALAQAHDAGPLERAALTILALACVALGLLPVQVLGALDHVTLLLLGSRVLEGARTWWLLAPIDAGRASYSAPVVLAVIVAVLMVTRLAVRRMRAGTRRAPAWDCGYPVRTARMQDTAEGFGQPIRQVFEMFFHVERALPAQADAAPRYAVRIEDRFWGAVYRPIATFVATLARHAGVLQQGRIGVYLGLSFATLIALLLLMPLLR
jgi:formate hydrogenlyase subunit 3/multisubunit Na+/H+ antiporter MnhD subunit